jgi:hypothetical protein
MAAKDKPSYICHRDGSVTYWSVFRQCWSRVRVIDDNDLATMPAKERERVTRHIERHERKDKNG